MSDLVPPQHGEPAPVAVPLEPRCPGCHRSLAFAQPVVQALCPHCYAPIVDDRTPFQIALGMLKTSVMLAKQLEPQAEIEFWECYGRMHLQQD